MGRVVELLAKPRERFEVERISGQKEGGLFHGRFLRLEKFLPLDCATLGNALQTRFV